MFFLAIFNSLTSDERYMRQLVTVMDYRLLGGNLLLKRNFIEVLIKIQKYNHFSQENTFQNVAGEISALVSCI